MIYNKPQRGFALLIAMVLTSVILAVALALLDVSYKELVLSSTAKQSQVAFYKADAAMECALYFDQQGTGSAFDYGITGAPSNIKCQKLAASQVSTQTSGAGVNAKRVTTFYIPCSSSDLNEYQAYVTVYKWQSATTSIYANGWNTCDTSDPRRIERGLKVTY